MCTLGRTCKFCSLQRQHSPEESDTIPRREARIQNQAAEIIRLRAENSLLRSAAGLQAVDLLGEAGDSDAGISDAKHSVAIGDSAKLA